MVTKNIRINIVLNFLLYLCLSMLSLSCSGQKNIKIGEYEVDTLFRQGSLENGFRYYIHKTDNDPNTAELRLIVKAGLDQENKDQLEYSHLLEHLTASSTINFPNVGDAVKSLGGFNYAQTTNVSTNYRLNIPNVNSEKVSGGLKILSDWAHAISFDEQSIHKQGGAVLGEGRVLNPYQKWWSQKLDSVISNNTGLSYMNPDKVDEGLRNFNLDALHQYYQDWYRPDLQAAIVVGDINVDSVETEIKKLFSDLRNPLNLKDAQERIKVAKLPGKNQYTSVIDTINPDLRLFVISKRKNFKNVLKGSWDFRNIVLQEIYESIIRTRSEEYLNQSKPAFSNFTMNYNLGNQMRLSLLTVSLPESDYKSDFYNALIDYRSMLSGFSVKEYNRAKEEILNEYSNLSKENLMGLAEKYADHFVHGASVYSNAEIGSIFIQSLKEISFHDLKKFGNDSFNLLENLDFIFFTPTKNIIPAPDVINAWVNNIKEMGIKPFKVEKPRKVKLDISGKDSIIKTHDFIKSENLIGITKVELNIGITIVFKPSVPSSERYANRLKIEGFRPIGVDPANKEEYLTNKYAPEIVQFFGAGGYSRVELQKFARENDMRLRFLADDHYHTIDASGRTKNLDKILSLMNLYIAAPNNDSEAFEMWKESKTMQLDDFGPRGSNGFYMDEIREIWYPDIPKLTIEDIRNLKQKEVWINFRENFSDPGGFTFVVTGDFATNEVLPYFINSFSTEYKDNPDLKNTYQYNFPMKPFRETIQLNNLDQTFIRLFFPVRVPGDEKNLIELELLSEALNENIKSRLREGSFAPRAHGEWLDEENNIYGFVIVFDSELGNEQRLIDYALDEFRKISKDGLDKEWFEVAINNKRINFKNELKYFGLFNFWRTYLKKQLKRGKELQDPVLRYGSYLEHFVSLADLNEAARKFMKEDNYQQFVILPKNHTILSSQVD